VASSPEARRSEQAAQDYLVETGLVDGGAEASLQQQLATLSAELGLAQSRALELQARARAMVELQRTGALDSAPDVIASRSCSTCASASSRSAPASAAPRERII
jgi:uncharacterized protein involved in exopolysaccharide biosynthesis